jgi:hypothetical protein
MTEIPSTQGEGRLDADLRELKAALREVRAPGRDPEALRGEFRAQHRAAHVRGESARRRPRRAAALATAAALAVGVAAGVLLGLDRFNGSGADQAQVEPAGQPNAAAIGAFQPLLYAPEFSPTGSYSVVRVRIPLSSLDLGQVAALEGTIEADVLLGEDGLARGIRFDVEDTLLVSTISR